MDKVKNFFVAIGMWFAHVGIAIAKWFKNWFVPVDDKEIIPVRIGRWFVNWRKPNSEGTTVWGRFIDRESGKTAVSTVICIAVGILLGAVFIIFTNAQHSAKAIMALLSGGIGSTGDLGRELGSIIVYACPLILTGLSVGFAYKAGLFNIGVAGQYVAGIFILYIAVYNWQLPWYVCTILAMLGGALWACLPGLLKSFCSVSEVISGIMLNWISLKIINSVLGGELYYNLTSAECYTISGDYKMPAWGLDTLFGGYKYMTIGIVLAIVAAVAIWVLLNKTKIGYEIKATGANKHAAMYAGMNEKRNTILTLAISGALAGLGAAIYYQSGITTWKITTPALPSQGFDGIAVAFLGALSPIGSIFSALLITYLAQGGSTLNSTYYSSYIADLVVAVIIYACAFGAFIRIFIQDKRRKHAEKAVLIADANAETSSVAEHSGEDDAHVVAEDNGGDE